MMSYCYYFNYAQIGDCLDIVTQQNHEIIFDNKNKNKSRMEELTKYFEN